MIEHPAVRHVNFTGSAAVGRKVARTCGLNLKPCLMELGGKNSAIVLKDADLQKAVEACVAGSFVSVSTSREKRGTLTYGCRRAKSAWQQTTSSSTSTSPTNSSI